MNITVLKNDFDTSNKYGYFRVYGGKNKINNLKENGFKVNENRNNTTITLHYNHFNIMQNIKYDLEIENIQTENGKYINITNINNLYCDIKNMDHEEQIDMLETIGIADTYITEFKKQYPNFLIDVLNGKKDEIIENKNELFTCKRTIKNLEKTIDKIMQNLLPVTIKKDFEHYNLTIKECYILVNSFSSYDKIKELFEISPYYILCDILNRPFFASDRLILDYNKELTNTKERYQYYIRSIILNNEKFTSDTFIFQSKLLENVKNNIKYIDDINKSQTEKISNFNYERVVEVISENDNSASSFVWLSAESTYILADKKTCMQEMKIKTFLHNFTKTNKKININIDNYTQDGNITLTDEQLDVINSVFTNKVTICNAKGGTGKTSILKQITKICTDNYINCILLAPTGRVSKKVTDTCGIVCNTIDRKYYTNVVAKDQQLECTDDTLLVVEEGGMLGTELFEKIIELIDYNQYSNIKLLINLDLEQLPPINKGCVLRDIINNKVQFQNLKVCELTKVFRYKDGGIAQKADIIRSGFTPFKDLTQKGSYFTHGKDLAFKKAESGYNLKRQIEKEYQIAYNHFKKQGYTHDEIIKKITIIAPFRKYKNGTIDINNTIQNIIQNITDKERKNKRTKIKIEDKIVELSVGDIVINTENNYKCMTKKAYQMLSKKEIKVSDVKLENFDDAESKGLVYPVFNGSFGTITDILPNGEIMCEFDGVEVIFDNETKYNLNLGYAVTTHKLQGSDNDYIISVITEKNKDFVTKNHIYTDITRSKRFFVGLWDFDTINKDVEIESIKDRNTLLNFFLSYDTNIKDVEQGYF